MLKVGEYVRTPEEGYIGKLVERIENAHNYYKIDVGREIIHCDNSRDNYIYSREGFGLKHSKNIIDLIEVGDIVHTRDVLEEDYYWMFDEEMIKATRETIESGIELVDILTHEQYEKNTYRLEENK